MSNKHYQILNNELGKVHALYMPSMPDPVTALNFDVNNTGSSIFLTLRYDHFQHYEGKSLDECIEYFINNYRYALLYHSSDMLMYGELAPFLKQEHYKELKQLILSHYDSITQTNV